MRGLIIGLDEATLALLAPLTAKGVLLALAGMVVGRGWTRTTGSC